jgi:hypothetical protein
MAHAVFILSTGRCGTQWLAAQLARHYSDVYRVEHEPLHNAYCPRRMLGCGSSKELGCADAAPILEHIESIERTLEHKHYIECGHPCWSTLPCFAERFHGRVRFIHLTRHPIPTAFSWLTHGAYEPPLLPHLQEKVLLSPFDAGVAFTEYRERWPALTPFEKCLYYWAEANAFGLRQETQVGAPWLRVSFESLFDGNALKSLIEFLELPVKDEVLAAKAANIDQFKYLTLARPDLSLVARHPRVIGVANELGYDASNAAVSPSQIFQRYMGLR